MSGMCGKLKKKPVLFSRKSQKSEEKTTFIKVVNVIEGFFDLVRLESVLHNKAQSELKF